jgi:phage baseplate assembly protein W
MAIEIGKVNVQDLSQNDYKSLGIGINRRSINNGIFAVNFTTIDQAKDNLINLILTKKGERLMQPNFGCDIWNIVFSPIVDEDISFEVETAINNAVESWLPSISITSIFVDTNDDLKDTNSIVVSLGFALKSNPRITDSVTITINQ